jgi:PhzF family phenazine biosynthesis protein
MARSRPFRQVDVFTAAPTLGNPVAVVLDADDLTDDEMAAFARWTNLSETTFVLAPTDPGADYRVRIFTPGAELPFAGHPTLGTAHAWREAGGTPAAAGTIVQQCAVGPVTVREGAGGRLAFAAPPLLVEEVAAETLTDVVAALGVAADDVLDARTLVNGPHWLTLRLTSAAAVLALAPDMSALAAVAGVSEVGVVGPHPAGGEVAVEVRGFAPAIGIVEDPVTGSLNAGIAQWLQGAGTLPDRYVAAQGTAMGRAGRVHVAHDGTDTWIGGDTVTVLDGTALL